MFVGRSYKGPILTLGLFLRLLARPSINNGSHFILMEKTYTAQLGIVGGK